MQSVHLPHRAPQMRPPPVDIGQMRRSSLVILDSGRALAISSVECHSTLPLDTSVNSATCSMTIAGAAHAAASFLNKSMSVGMVYRHCSVNTLARPCTFLNMTYPASVSIANRFDTFAHFDALTEIDDAGLRMRY